MQLLYRKCTNTSIGPPRPEPCILQMNIHATSALSLSQLIPLSMCFNDLLFFLDESSPSSWLMDAGDELSLSFFFSKKSSGPFLILFDREVSLSAMLPGRCLGFAGVISRPVGRCLPLVGRETTLLDALGGRVNLLSLANDRRGLSERTAELVSE